MRLLLDGVGDQPKGTMVEEAGGGNQEQHAVYQMAALDAHGL
jgi:hypothetical protein